MEYFKIDKFFYPLSIVELEVRENKINCSLDLIGRLIGSSNEFNLGDIGSNGLNDNSIQRLVQNKKIVL